MSALGGGTASINLPAPGSNVSYLVTRVAARLLNFNGAGSVLRDVTVNDGVQRFLWRLFAPQAPAGGAGEDDFDQSLGIICAQGAAVTIAFSAVAAATESDLLLVQATAI
ncbi:MAG TPA: hypothetical protein VF032_19530 [Thermoleophilaceae bacterium]